MRPGEWNRAAIIVNAHSGRCQTCRAAPDDEAAQRGSGRSASQTGCFDHVVAHGAEANTAPRASGQRNGPETSWRRKPERRTGRDIGRRTGKRLLGGVQDTCMDHQTTLAGEVHRRDCQAPDQTNQGASHRHPSSERFPAYGPRNARRTDWKQRPLPCVCGAGSHIGRNEGQPPNGSQGTFTANVAGPREPRCSNLVLGFDEFARKCRIAPRRPARRKRGRPIAPAALEPFGQGHEPESFSCATAPCGSRPGLPLAPGRWPIR